MDELLLFTVTIPSLHFKQTGSFLQLLLMSSPLSIVGRALLLFTIDEPFTALQADELPPIICIDEPFTAYQSDGLPLTNLIDELSPQQRWTSSYNSLPDELFLTTLPDNLSPLTHVAEFYSTTHTDEQSPTIPKEELYSPPTINDLSHK